MKRTLFSFIAGAIAGTAATVGCVMLYEYCTARNWTLRLTPDQRHYRQLEVIGMEIHAFERDHGKLPEMFSDIFPEYISAEQAKIFFCDYGTPMGITDVNTLRELIERFGMFDYRGNSRSERHILVIERSGTWNSASKMRFVLYSDYKIARIDDPGLRRRDDNGGSALPGEAGSAAQPAARSGGDAKDRGGNGEVNSLANETEN